jgi:hypothetical protein
VITIEVALDSYTKIADPKCHIGLLLVAIPDRVAIPAFTQEGNWSQQQGEEGMSGIGRSSRCDIAGVVVVAWHL